MQEENPWEVKQVKPIYDNPWINVKEHNVINPAGNPGIYGVVQFKHKAVAIVPVDKEGNTWLVGQYRYPLGIYSWELPEGGALTEKETLLEAAQRELLEETGLVAQKWTPILKMHLSNSITDESSVTFLAQNLEIGEMCPEETEVLTLKKIPLKEAIENCLEGVYTDALTIASLLKVNAMLQRGDLVL